MVIARHVDDAVLDRVEIMWDGREGNFLTQTGFSYPEDADIERILRSFAIVASWETAFTMAECGALHRSAIMENREIEFEIDTNTVLIDDGQEEALRLGEAAFNRFLTRIFKALINGAQSQSLPVTKHPNWREFVERADSLNTR